MKRVFTIVLLSTLAFVACNKQDAQNKTLERGTVSIECGATTEVELTRASLTTEVQCSVPASEEFSLKISGVSSDYVAEYASVSEFEDTRLYKGSYVAEIISGDINDEGYDKPVFSGEQTFDILSRQHTDVSITATIANALVKVETTEAFKSYFPGGYSLTLTTELGNEFDVTSQSDYLFVAPTSFVINGTATKQVAESGAEAVVVTLPEMRGENLAPRTIYTVRFDVSEAGSATLRITLNETLVEERTFDNELNQYA